MQQAKLQSTKKAAGFTLLNKKRAPANKTLTLNANDIAVLSRQIKTIRKQTKVSDIVNRVLHQDLFSAIPHLPAGFTDLLFIDPPYNLTKVYGSSKFARRSEQSYEQWLESWVQPILATLKPNASVYICCDWQSSPAVYNVVSQYLKVMNRITWERDKGRGAKTNWKNNLEDIWYCTHGEGYTFNLEDVKIKKKVIAPYRNAEGKPKDWSETQNGNYRMTSASNIWTDLTVPFWSMPENTDHPTQKPEKLLARIILASSNPADIVFDPFAGSGTTAVVAKKLGRKYIAIEREEEYCLLAQKRLNMAEKNPRIQGYSGGVFWERNSLNEQKNKSAG